MDQRFRRVHGNLTEHILAPNQVGDVQDLQPEPVAELRLTPDTKVLCIHRGRNERREGCFVGLEDATRLDRERIKGVAYRGDIVDTFDGHQYIIAPGYFTVAYGAALHFKNRAVVPGSRNPETRWQASFIAILGIWSTTGAGPKIIKPVDPAEEWAPFTDDEYRRYKLAAEAPDRPSTIGSIDPDITGVPMADSPANTHRVDADQAAASSADQAASLTYEPYYGLEGKPFSLSTDPRFLYRSRSHAPAFDDLYAALRRREGLIVLTGDIGTGKTMLCRAALQHLDLKTFTTVVAEPLQSREDFLKTLLVHFGVTKSDRMKGASRADLIYPLYEFLDRLAPLQTFAVLIVDEAQNLSLPLFEEIRLLSDLEGRGKLLQVVLVGQIDFRSQLKQPEMRQISQRVSVHCELEPLGREEVTGYVTYRLKVAGGGDDRIGFSPGALDLVYSESDGVPRLINLLCDRALHHAWVKRTAVVEPDEVWKAVVDLGLGAPLVPAAPESLKGHRPPRGMFERATQLGESSPPGNADLRALLTISPVTRQTDRSPSEVAPAEPGPLDAFAAEPIAQPVEAHGERRPGSRAVRGQVEDGQERPTRRVSPLVAALAVVTALAGGAALALGSQRAIRLFVADLLSTIAPPSPRPVPTAPIRQVPPPPDPPTLQEVRPPALPGSSSAPGTETAGSYAVQVASFESAPLANRLVKVLEDKGYRAYLVEVELGARGHFQRVFVGRYRTLDEAASDLARIREMPGRGDAKILDVQQSHIAPEPR